VGAAGAAALVAVLLVLTVPVRAGSEPELRVRRSDGSAIDRMPLDRYVAAVVAAEMPTGWPAAALRAQAIASRTYALYRQSRNVSERWDIESDTRGQVLRRGRIPARPARAVRETEGQILLYAGRPIEAVFHAASGGQTAAAAEVWGEHRPYLISIHVAGEDAAPETYWRATVSRPTLRRALDQLGLDVGPVEAARIEQRTPSGRVGRVGVKGERGVVTLSGRELRSALGETAVKSTLFDLRPRGEGFVIVGTGYGHGVGMSQWGANAMAERGASHGEILSTFYPGAELVTLSADALARIGAGSPLAAEEKLPAVATSGEQR
jgi:stage II sporulation protein D